MLKAREKPLVHLQTVRVQPLGHLDPVEHGHRPGSGDGFEVALGKGGQLWFHWIRTHPDKSPGKGKAREARAINLIPADEGRFLKWK
jgi:hypothetical protein